LNEQAYGEAALEWTRRAVSDSDPKRLTVTALPDEDGPQEMALQSDGQDGTDVDALAQALQGRPRTRVIPLKAVNELATQVETVLREVFVQLERLLPSAELHHIGATAVPNAVTKGDVDVLVRVRGSDFGAAVAALRDHFAVKQPGNWTSEFASFGDDIRYALPLGVQLVVTGSRDDFLLFLRDYLIANKEALLQYNQLKLAHAPDGAEAYWHAKNAFFAEILAARIV